MTKDTGSLPVQVLLHLSIVRDTHDFLHVHPKIKVRSLHSRAVQRLGSLAQACRKAYGYKAQARTPYFIYSCFSTALPVVLCGLGRQVGRGALLNDSQAAVEGSMNSSHLQKHPGTRSFQGECGSRLGSTTEWRFGNDLKHLQRCY